MNNAGTVMANSIAFEISSHFNRFGKWQTGDLVARSMVAGKVKEHQSANRGEITIWGPLLPPPVFVSVASKGLRDCVSGFRINTYGYFYKC